MAITRSIGVKPLDDVGATPLDMKNTIAALLTQTGVNEPQLGVLSPFETPLVAGTNELAYKVGRCQVAVSPGPGYGAHLLTVTDPVQASTVAGSPTGVRIDLVTIRQQDPDVGDGSNEPIIEVVQGDTVEANPVPPTDKIPAGSLVLAEVTVPAGMNSTAAANITVTVPLTGLRGAALAEETVQLPGVGGWNVVGYVQKKRITQGIYEVSMNGRFQRAVDSFNLAGDWINLFPAAIPEGFRPKKNPNNDIMRATGHTFPWMPIGDVAQQSSLQLEAPDSGNIWARAMSGTISIPQWSMINVNMSWLADS